MGFLICEYLKNGRKNKMESVLFTNATHYKRYALVLLDNRCPKVSDEISEFTDDGLRSVCRYIEHLIDVLSDSEFIAVHFYDLHGIKGRYQLPDKVVEHPALCIENNYYACGVDISNEAFLVLLFSILRMCYECKVEDFVSYTQIDERIKTLIYMHIGHFYEVRRVLP